MYKYGVIILILLIACNSADQVESNKSAETIDDTTNNLYVIFDSTHRLQSTNRVKYEGRTIGAVQKISPLNNQVLVKILIDAEEFKIQNSASFVLSSDGILGSKCIVIHPSDSMTHLTYNSGDTVQGTIEVGISEWDTISMSNKASILIGQIDSTVSLLNHLIVDSSGR